MNNKLSTFIALFIVAIIIISSVIAVFIIYSNEEQENDNESPKIHSVSTGLNAAPGDIINININFSDNENVTEALLFYKSEFSDKWSNKSILSGNANIQIPSSSTEDWFYYVTVNDEADNGPVGEPSIDGSRYYTITVNEIIRNFEHTVFIEEGTANWCDNCPIISDIIENLYESGNYNFYYVSLIEDQSNIAKNRLEEDYNILGYPTLFIDGGYKVMMGSLFEKSDIENEISKAEDRNAPNININVKVEYKNISDELVTNIVVQNGENSTYTGFLKIYLTEIISRWVNDYATSPYHYSFIDYIIEEEISVDANEDFEKNYTKKLTDFEVSNLDPDNLMIIGVVFNSNSVNKYSNPDETANEFDAYYADAANGSRVVEGGNLPPSIAIEYPHAGKINIFGRSFVRTIYRNTYVIGLLSETKIIANVSDYSEIDRVEFYIDDELKGNVTEEPYELSFRKIDLIKHIFRKHTVKAVVYDDIGKTAEDSLEFYGIWL